MNRPSLLQHLMSARPQLDAQEPLPAWEVLLNAPVRQKIIHPHLLHGNLRGLISWGPRGGKTRRLIELAGERVRYARVAVVCDAGRAVWIQAQLPDARVIGISDGRLPMRQLRYGLEEVFVDDLERLNPESSAQLIELADRGPDVTFAVSAQSLPAPEAFWNAWFDRPPPRQRPVVSEALIGMALDLELVDDREPYSEQEHEWQAATARMILRERDARVPQAHLLPHTLVVLPGEPQEVERPLRAALSEGGRVFAFLPPKPGMWHLKRPEGQTIGLLCAALHVPLIAPVGNHLAFRRAQLALQAEHVSGPSNFPWEGR